MFVLGMSLAVFDSLRLAADSLKPLECHWDALGMPWVSVTSMTPVHSGYGESIVYVEYMYPDSMMGSISLSFTCFTQMFCSLPVSEYDLVWCMLSSLVVYG